MCGRYSLAVRVALIRRQLEQLGQEVDDAPDDGAVKETYNFAPGYSGIVYRADTDTATENEPEKTDKTRRYKLQSMKWGLVPFWTKRAPDYGSMMRTINCRDDSLIEDKGMWTTMKRKKRCVVISQGFYEWQKAGQGKMPHFIRRQDGNLMCFAGLWDCAQFGGPEKLYTYTIITTSSNKYLSFLHDRMPVILDAGSEAMKKWLDPNITTWTKELQSFLNPYPGELECYPVSKEVGKVGNDSPKFIIPVNSKENKSNIANFFGNAQAAKDGNVPSKPKASQEESIKHEKTSPGPEVPKAQKHRRSSDSDKSPSKAIKTESQEHSHNATANTSLEKARGSPRTAKTHDPGMKPITSFFNK